MPIFRKRNLKRHTLRFLYRQVDNKSLPVETRQAIARALERDDVVEKVNNYNYKALTKAKRLERLEGMPDNAVGGEILDALMKFLSEHLDEIIALIFKLLGL